MVRKHSVNFIIDLGKALEGSGIYSSATRLAKGLHDYGYDVYINSRKPTAIVHLHTALPQSFYKALRIKKMRQKYDSRHPKLVMHGHTTVEDFVNSFLFSNQIKPLLKRYLPYYYNLADAMVAVSIHNKNLLVNYGISAEKISIISNGIRLNSAFKSPVLRRQARIKLGLKAADTLVIGLGISLYRKGIDRFIDIAEQLPDVKFIWIGKRLPTGLLAQARYLKKKYIKAGKLPNCQFTGYVSVNTLRGLLNASDIFIFPTREENQGIALLEAILYDKPSIISKLPVFKEYEEGIHVLKADSITEFVENINLLRNNQDFSGRLVNNARIYLEKHDIQHSIEKTAELYNKLLE